MFSIVLMRMIRDFLEGRITAKDFSFDFPARLSHVYNDFRIENEELCDYLEDEMPEMCSWFDPNNTACDGTYDEETFKKKVSDVYYKALPLILSQQIKIIS